MAGQGTDTLEATLFPEAHHGATSESRDEAPSHREHEAGNADELERAGLEDVVPQAHEHPMHEAVAPEQTADVFPKRTVVRAPTPGTKLTIVERRTTRSLSRPPPTHAMCPSTSRSSPKRTKLRPVAPRITRMHRCSMRPPRYSPEGVPLPPGHRVAGRHVRRSRHETQGAPDSARLGRGIPRRASVGCVRKAVRAARLRP